MSGTPPTAGTVVDPPIDSPEFEALSPQQQQEVRWREKGWTEEQGRAHQARSDARQRRRRRRGPFAGIGLWLARRLPLPLAAILGECAGRLIYFGSSSLRQRGLGHLETALGRETTEAERRRIARRCFGLMGRSATSYARLAGMGRDRALRQVTVEGVEHLADALAEGKGVLSLSLHFGVVDLIAAWVAREFGGPMVGRTGAGATRILIGFRKDLGVETIERGDTRRMLRALEAGQSLGLAADHDVHGVNGVFVRFFGSLAHTPTGPARLAVRRGAPIVLATIVWDGLTRHRIRFEPPMRPREDLAGDEAVFELTHRFTQRSEQLIRRHPEHWYWVHRRWEKRPEDHPEAPVFDPTSADG